MKKITLLLMRRFGYKDFYFGKVNYLKPIKVSKKEYYKIQSFFSKQEDLVISNIREKDPKKNNFSIPKVVLPAEARKISENGDWLGVTYSYEKKFYKSIKSESVKAFTDLYYSGLLQTFSDFKYIPKFKISEFYSNEFPLFLEIEPIKKVSYDSLSIEKCIETAIFVAFLQEICKRNGFSLQDPHMENFCYSEGHPYYLDFGSFEHQIHHSKEYSLVVSLIYQIIFSYFPNSIFHDYFIYGLNTNWCSDKNSIFKYNKSEIRKVMKKFVLFHKYESSYCVYKAAKRIIKKFDCRPVDLYLLFSDRLNLSDLDFTKFK